MGLVEKAEPLKLEATAIEAEMRGEKSPNYATSLNKLALLYKKMPLFEKADSL